MRSVVVLSVLLLGPAVLIAKPRKFTDSAGNSMQAELAGVKDGHVLLAKGRSERVPVRLSGLSLDDRDFVAEELKRTNRLPKLRELMLKAFRRVRSFSKERNIPMRLAALSLGVNKVALEKAKRGLFP